MTAILRVLRAVERAHGTRSGRAKRLTEIYDPLILGRKHAMWTPLLLAILDINIVNRSSRCRLRSFCDFGGLWKVPRFRGQARHLSATCVCRHTSHIARRRNRISQNVVVEVVPTAEVFPLQASAELAAAKPQLT
jgi:hypothetical protein